MSKYVINIEIYQQCSPDHWDKFYYTEIFNENDTLKDIEKRIKKYKCEELGHTLRLNIIPDTRKE